VDRARQLTADTLRNQMSYIHGFYAWCVAEGLLTFDPSERLDRPRVTRRVPRPMDDARVGEAIENADPRMRLIVSLGAFAGLRCAEIAGLDWADVQLGGKTPHLRIVGKGGHERVVDVAPVLEALLAALPHRRGPVIRRLDGGLGPNTACRISQLGNE